jgi:hypothetical protein
MVGAILVSTVFDGQELQESREGSSPEALVATVRPPGMTGIAFPAIPDGSQPGALARGGTFMEIPGIPVRRKQGGCQP